MLFCFSVDINIYLSGDADDGGCVTISDIMQSGEGVLLSSDSGFLKRRHKLSAIIQNKGGRKSVFFRLLFFCMSDLSAVMSETKIKAPVVITDAFSYEYQI